VVIPCFDGEDTLGATLTSLALQTRRPDRVIVCDDGSRDGSVAVAQAHGAEVLQGPCGGGSAARNAGLQAARDSDAVMFLDADDLLLPDTLEALERALPSGGLSRCDWRRYELRDGAWIVAPRSCAPRAPWQDDLSAWLTGWYCPPCALLWTREALDRAGPWLEEPGAVNQDGEIVMRALTAGLPLAKADGGLALYRRPADGRETVSARRFRPESLHSRVKVIDGVAERLREAGRARRYRGAVAEAYRQILIDANEAGEAAAIVRERLAALRSARPPSGLTLRARRVAAGRQVASPVTMRAPQVAAAPPGGAPFVSVVIPTFRRPAATLEAVRSVLTQDYEPFEVVVVDDASGDDTVSLLSALGDPRLRVIELPENGGVAAARNAGVAAARGEAIAFLDSDDWWLPGKLSAQAELLRAAGPRTGIVLTGCEVRRTDRTDALPPPPSGDVRAALLARNVLNGFPSCGLVRRPVFDLVGGFDERLPAAEDWDFALRACRFFDVASVPENLTVITDLDQGADAPRRSRALRANMRARDLIHARYRGEMRAAGAEGAFLMESARRRLSERGAGAWAGRRDVLSALALRPGNPRLYPWLAYMLLPGPARAALRRIEGRAEPRPV
jgi:glycosyltransferase involved in cell wall biosynthesis